MQYKAASDSRWMDEGGGVCNKILLINMGSGPDFAHRHTSLPSPVWTNAPTSCSGGFFVDLWLALYSHAKIGRMRSQGSRSHCSPRSVASPKSYLGIASLDNFTQQCQESISIPLLALSLWIFFLTVGKISSLWLITADVMKWLMRNFPKQTALGHFSGRGPSCMEWLGRGWHASGFLCIRTKKQSLWLLGLCV